MAPVLRAICLLVLLAGCETPEAERGSAPSYPTYTAPPPRETVVARTARECSDGDKLACTILATAYEKGEPLVTAPGEIIVRNDHHAAYYEGRACSLGDVWKCLALANRTLEGKGVEKNEAKAAELYSTACDSGEVLEFASGQACAVLGKLYVLGKGVPWNNKKGLDLLRKACSMGNNYGCSLRASFGGTGNFSERPPPDGALGFTFGWSTEAAKGVCVQSGGKWSKAVDAADTYFCRGFHVTAIDHDATIELEYAGDRLVTLTAIYDISPDDGPKEFQRVSGLLTEVYGTPSDRTYEMLDKCPEGLADCIRSKRAMFQAFWAFKDKHAITCGLERYKDEPLALMLQYMTPDTPSNRSHSGL